MHGFGTGGDKPRPYKASARISCTDSAAGDGLVPSRLECTHDAATGSSRTGTDFVHGFGTGGDKPRPYKASARISCTGTAVGDGLVPSRLECTHDAATALSRTGTDCVHGFGTGGDKPRPYKKGTDE